MAKLTCFLALFVVFVVCAEAIRIDPVRPAKRGKHISNLKKDDKDCQKGNGMYAIKGDCTKYYKCVNGNRQNNTCPDGMKFDSSKHCVLPQENPDCGNKTSAPSLDGDVKCPQSVGMFQVKSDCHKYMFCKDRVPEVKECPDKMFFSYALAKCIRSKTCPQMQSEADVKCKKADGCIADKDDCRKYKKCVNFKPVDKTCPPGKAIDVKKCVCTVEKRRSCKSNHIHQVEADE